MTALNLVSVTITADPSPADTDIHGAQVYPEGNYVFTPSGAMWPDPSQNPVIPMVLHGVLVNGTASASLAASDNFSAGVLTWNAIINIRGLPTINVAGFPVNFSNGASQSVWPLLAAAGWAPTSQP